MKALAAILAATATATAACGDELPPVVWEGEHVRFGTNLDREAWCLGNLERLDTYTGMLKATFAVPDDLVVDYFLFAPPVSDHSNCPPDAAGCVDEVDPVVFSAWLPHDHEVVHAVNNAHGGMPRFFEEGAASYWGDLMRHRPEIDGLSLREVLLESPWDGDLDVQGYALAAHFTAYLVDTYGLPAYVDLLHASKDEQSREVFEQAFETAMGVPLQAAVVDYGERWPPSCAPARALLYECAQPAREIGSAAEESLEIDISCNDPAVRGPRPDHTGTAKLWRDLTVDLTERATSFNFEDPPPGEVNSSSVEIIPCSKGCETVATYTKRFRPSKDGDNWGWPTDLPPGRYVVRVMRDADDPGEVRFRLR